MKNVAIEDGFCGLVACGPDAARIRAARYWAGKERRAGGRSTNNCSSGSGESKGCAESGCDRGRDLRRDFGAYGSAGLEPVQLAICEGWAADWGAGGESERRAGYWVAETSGYSGGRREFMHWT